MRMEYLRYLLEIQRKNSIAMAAEELYLGQTTLRTIVKSVEEELGLDIFRRVYRGVNVTPEGEEAFALISEINDLFQQAQTLNCVLPSMIQPVRIILPPTINSVLAVPLSQMFYEKVPEGELDFQTVLSQEVGSQMIKEGNNIGFAYFSDDNFDTYGVIAGKYQLEVKKLLRDNQYLVVSSRNVLANQEQISYSEIKNINFAMLPHYVSPEHSNYIQYFGPGNCYTVFSSISLVKQAVLKQNMATILPGFCFLHDQNIGHNHLRPLILKENDGKERRGTNLCLIYRQHHNLNDSEKILLQCVEEYFEQIAPIPQPVSGWEGE